MRKMVRKMMKVIMVTRQNGGKLNNVDNATQAGSEKHKVKDHLQLCFIFHRQRLQSK